MSENFEELDVSPPVGAELDAGSFGQADIDALFGDVAAPLRASTGVRALIENAAGAQERLPLLEVICDRVLRTLATNMRHLTSDVMEVSLEEVTGGRFGELMNRAALPAMFGVFRVDPWSDHGVIVIEPSLIYAVVDGLLGGRKGVNGPTRIDGRAFTSIETALVGRTMELILRDFATAFELVADVQFTLERIETSPRFAAISGPAIGTAQCVFRVDMEGRGGRFCLLLPTTTLEPVKDKLMQRFMGEKLGNDDAWTTHFDRELRRSPIRVSAVLAERTMSLGAIDALRAGDTLHLMRGADEPVVLAHDADVLASAQLGQRSGKIALRLLGQLTGVAS